MTIPTEYYRQVRREPFLIGYWRFNDLSGTRALDWAGKYNINGIYNGEPVSDIPLIFSDSIAGSKLFGNENQSMEVPDAEPLHVTGDITLEAWILILSSSQTASIFSKMNTAFSFPNPFYLGLKNGKISFSLGNGATETSITASSVLPISVPLHIVASCFRKKMKIFVNGTEIITGELGSQSVTDAGKPIYFGELGNDTSRFNGMIGEGALYSSALASTKAQLHFGIGRQIIYEKPYYITYDPPSYS